MVSECIIHPGAPGSDGYTVINIDGKAYRANRHAWKEAYGKIPDGLHVLHKCDVRRCINPEHLFLGTNADNVQDRVLKNRSYRPKGELNIKAKLSSKEVSEIRSFPRFYGYRKILSSQYGISAATIADIISGKTWKEA